jgi:putative phage-type endonuclease
MGMKMKIIECIQGSEEWFAARMGMITASRFDAVKAKNRKGDGYGETRRKYMLQLAAERLFGEIDESYTNAAMERGKELETYARQAYEINYETAVEQVGFIQLDDWVGASPDGLIGTDGQLEIKVPKGTTYLEHEDTGMLIGDYKHQTQGQLWVTGRQWCDFVVYHPKADRPIVTRLYRDEDYIKMLEIEVNKFKQELQEYIDSKTRKVGF